MVTSGKRHRDGRLVDRPWRYRPRLSLGELPGWRMVALVVIGGAGFVGSGLEGLVGGPTSADRAWGALSLVAAVVVLGLSGLYLSRPVHRRE